MTHLKDDIDVEAEDIGPAPVDAVANPALDIDRARKPRSTAIGHAATDRPVPAIWLLAMMTLTGTVAIHIFIPALPFAAADLGASPRAMQLTIGSYILGMAVGQPIYGPLADHFGRRPVLLGGLAIYAVASLAAAFAPSGDSLIAIRFVQALGGCAGTVLARAIIRDISDGGDAAGKLAVMSLMINFGPGIAPILGSVFAALGNWRMIFVALAVIGFVNLGLAFARLPETRPAGPSNAKMVVRNYGLLLRSPRFLCYAVGGSTATTAFYAFIGSAAFVLVEQLHQRPAAVGLYMGTTVIGTTIGSLSASRMAKRMSTHAMIRLGTWLIFAAATGFLVQAVSGTLTPVGFLVCLQTFLFGSSVAAPGAMVGAMSVHPGAVASASGLYGSFQMANGALCASLAGLGSDHALSAALVLCTACLISKLCFMMARRMEAPAG